VSRGAEERGGKGEEARAGLIENFTGISDPCEPPEDAEVVVDASRMSPEEGVQQILSYLEEKGFLSPEAQKASRPRGKLGMSEGNGVERRAIMRFG